MADRCGAELVALPLDVLSQPPPAPPARAGRRALDASSPVFMVDHSACILCDRCVRACDDVKENNVIGRTGKGATAGIGFDLNEPMGESTCVQCGECMVSCPTTAITFKPVAKVKPRRTRRPRGNAVRGGTAARSGLRRRAAEVPALAARPCRSATAARGPGSLPQRRAGQHRVHHQVRRLEGSSRSPVCDQRAAFFGGLLGTERTPHLSRATHAGRYDRGRNGVPERLAAHADVIVMEDGECGRCGATCSIA